MINVEEWFMVRELARQGLSIPDIAQRVGCDRQTVRKYLVLWFNRNGHLDKGAKLGKGGVPPE